MDKAKLVEILKEEGVNIAEDQAVSLVKGVFKALPKIAEATENKVDDLVVPLLLVVEPKVLEVLDKIDGQVG